jgi:hypothetical protein
MTMLLFTDWATFGAGLLQDGDNPFHQAAVTHVNQPALLRRRNYFGLLHGDVFKSSSVHFPKSTITAGTAKS